MTASPMSGPVPIEHLRRPPAVRGVSFALQSFVNGDCLQCCRVADSESVLNSDSLVGSINNPPGPITDPSVKRQYPRVEGTRGDVHYLIQGHPMGSHPLRVDEKPGTF